MAQLGAEAGAGRWGSVFDRLYDPVTCEPLSRRAPLRLPKRDAHKLRPSIAAVFADVDFLALRTHTLLPFLARCACRPYSHRRRRRLAPPQTRASTPSASSRARASTTTAR